MFENNINQTKTDIEYTVWNEVSALPRSQTITVLWT